MNPEGGIPYGMKVFTDQGNQQDTSCPIPSTNGVIRNIIYQAFDRTGANAGAFPIQEPAPAPISSCNNVRAQLSSNCSGITRPDGKFLDQLYTAYCSRTPNNSCGFQPIPDTWQVCTNGQTPTIGSPNYVVHWNSVTINGEVSLPSGTPMP